MRRNPMQSLSLGGLISGLVWVACGFVLVLVKVSLFTSSASIYWEYVGGFMILFGVVRLLWAIARGSSKPTKPRFWSGYI